MNQLTTTPVQPLTLCHMPKGDRPIDMAIWYFSDTDRHDHIYVIQNKE